MGYRPDQRDDRDHMLRLQAPGLPPRAPQKASVLTARYAIKDQGGTASCVGQALANAVRLGYLVGNESQCPDLSALFAYFNGRKESGDDVVVDSGTYLRESVKAIQKFGLAPELAWPFSAWNVNKQPSWNSYRTAHDYRGLRAYYRISSGDVDGVRAAIASKRPVVAGWMVSRSFVEHTGNGVIGPQLEPFLGGHALLIGAYDGPHFTIVNSWGEAWGKRGLATVDEGFVRQARDIWAIDV